MRTLEIQELEVVGGGVDQTTAIGTNAAIALAGAAGMATAPAWVPAALIVTSVAVTAAYISEALDGDG